MNDQLYKQLSQKTNQRRLEVYQKIENLLKDNPPYTEEELIAAARDGSPLSQFIRYMFRRLFRNGK